jgi:hypothetical protein
MRGEMFSCLGCGAIVSAENRVAQTGDLETYRCPSCDKEWFVNVSRAFPELHDEVKVRALLRWHGNKPSPVELSGLRQVVSEFRDLGLLDVLEAVRGKSSWELGIFPRPYALAELMILAKKNGLTLELEEIDVQP